MPVSAPSTFGPVVPHFGEADPDAADQQEAPEQDRATSDSGGMPASSLKDRLPALHPNIALQLAQSAIDRIKDAAQTSVRDPDAAKEQLGQSIDSTEKFLENKVDDGRAWLRQHGGQAGQGIPDNASGNNPLAYERTQSDGIHARRSFEVAGTNQTLRSDTDAAIFSPASEQFISRDPLEGENKLPVTWGAYQYGRYNPYLCTDPTRKAEMPPVCRMAGGCSTSSDGTTVVSEEALRSLMRQPRTIAEIIQENLASPTSEAKPLSDTDAFFALNPVGQTIKGLYKGWTALPTGLYNLARDAEGYASNAISPQRSVITGEVFPYQPKSGLMQSIEQNGVGGTIGIGIVGTVRNAPGIGLIRALYAPNRDWSDVGAQTFGTGAALVAFAPSSMRTGTRFPEETATASASGVRVAVGGVDTTELSGRLSPTQMAAKGGTSFATTESVTVSGSRAIDLGKSYEAGVQGMYNGTPYKYSTLVNGQEVNGIADTVTSVAGKQTAVEAKFVEDWATSLRNPASPVGNKPWAISEQQAMVNQATKYSSYFDGGVIYHTNSTELAAYYSQVFKDAGITNFKFVITPAVK